LPPQQFPFFPEDPLGPGLRTLFGVMRPANDFGFTISRATNRAAVVEASTNLANWEPLQTNRLASGAASFNDPQGTNYPGRFYRLRSR
jgi:hypothetical protein